VGASSLTAAEIIRLLDLKPHPEGGHFHETFRDSRAIEGRGERSHWHRVDAVEVWHFHAGSTLKLGIAHHDQGPIEHVMLGSNLAAREHPQAVVPAGAWQAAESLGDWTLVGCTVAPGFDFSTFELAPKGWLPGQRG
jgi:predicted cupin superfamily sugar epimerase